MAKKRYCSYESYWSWLLKLFICQLSWPRGQWTICRIIYLNNMRFICLPVMPSISCFIKSICFWTLGSIFLLNNWQNKGFSETSLRASRVVFANSVHSSHKLFNMKISISVTEYRRLSKGSNWEPVPISSTSSLDTSSRNLWQLAGNCFLYSRICYE